MISAPLTLLLPERFLLDIRSVALSFDLLRMPFDLADVMIE
jgi:hypothetical protein